MKGERNVKKISKMDINPADGVGGPVVVFTGGICS